MRKPRSQPPSATHQSYLEAAVVAEVPELSGCMAHGNNQSEALQNVRDTMDLWLETATEFGDPIPQPKGRRLMLA